MPNANLLNDLYYHIVGDVWILDGGSSLVTLQSISAAINMYLANESTPQIYFFNINNALFEHMKHYFSGLNFTTLGLEQMGFAEVSNILTSLPESVTTIGIENLARRPLDTFYRKIKEFSKSKRHIHVICGPTIPDDYKAKFLLLNGQVTEVSEQDATQMIIKSVATVVKTERNKNKKRKHDLKPVVVETSADLIIRQMKRIKDLEDALGMNSSARTYMSLLEENKILDERTTQLTIDVKNLNDRNTYLTNQLESSNNRLFELDRRSQGLGGIADFTSVKTQTSKKRQPVHLQGLLSSSSPVFPANPLDTSPAFSSASSSVSAFSLSNYSLFPSWMESSSSSSSRQPKMKLDEAYIPLGVNLQQKSYNK